MMVFSLPLSGWSCWRCSCSCSVGSQRAASNSAAGRRGFQWRPSLGTLVTWQWLALTVTALPTAQWPVSILWESPVPWSIAPDPVPGILCPAPAGTGTGTSQCTPRTTSSPTGWAQEVKGGIRVAQWATVKTRSDSIWTALVYRAYVLTPQKSVISWKKAGLALYISVFHAGV